MPMWYMHRTLQLAQSRLICQGYVNCVLQLECAAYTAVVVVAQQALCLNQHCLLSLQCLATGHMVPGQCKQFPAGYARLQQRLLQLYCTVQSQAAQLLSFQNGWPLRCRSVDIRIYDGILHSN
jgi:hypothetical protein